MKKKKNYPCFGAELILTKAEDSIGGSVAEVERLKSQNTGIFVPHAV